MENSIDAWCSYRAARNLYKVKLVNSENKCRNSKINTAKDQKEMWNRIKNLVLGKPLTLIKKNVMFDVIEYTGDVEIAQRFNEYFINSIRDICNSIGKV